MWMFFLIPNESANGQLTIEIDEVQQAIGTIWVGIYDSKSSFLIKEKAIIKEIAVTHKGRTKVNISGLPYGTYAIALFHDLNNNGELDQNLFGVPTEPYAFSKPPVSKWRVPYFHEIAFRFQAKQQSLKAVLQNWY